MLDGRPSVSAMVPAFAVSVCPCVAAPAIVGAPVAASFTLATLSVAVEVRLSVLPPPSVNDTVTLMCWPTSACTSV